MSDLTPAQLATLRQLQKGRTIHRAAKINGSGEVSALCYRKPRAIPMRKNVSWTIGAETVTCPKCRAIQSRLAPEAP